MTPQTITTHEDDHRTSAEIQSDIRHTRERMDSTLDELGNRLTARSLLNTALDWWDSPNQGNQSSVAARKAAVMLARQARRHPGPALLFGGGIAWLIADAMQRKDEEVEIGGVRYHRSYRPTRTRSIPPNAAGPASGAMGAASSAKHKAGDAMESAKHMAEDAMGRARETVDEYGDKLHHVTNELGEQAQDAYHRSQAAMLRLKDEVKEGYHTGADRFSRACDDYPLAVGAGFAALGALAALAIPRTRREDELMGEQSDHLVAETKEKAGELLESGKSVGARVVDVVKEEARAQGLTGSTLAEKISDLVGRGGEVVKKPKVEAVHAAEDAGLTPKQMEQKAEQAVEEQSHETRF